MRRRRGVGRTQRALDARTHPAWTRLKFDELLAQQLSLKAHRKARAQRGAPVLTGTRRAHAAAARARGLQAHARAGARVARDRARSASARRRCSACCRATSAAARRSSPRSRRCRRSKAAGRSRSWRRPRSSPSSTIASSRRGSTGSACAIAWLSGSVPAKAAQEGAGGARERRDAFAVGTHALFQEGVAIPQLGLAIVDEQHRFGVAQRLALRGKGSGRSAPADDERDADPAHARDELLRRPRRVGARRDAAGPHAGRDAAREPDAAAQEIVGVVGKRCAEGRQAYWVCPLIEESEKLELQTAVALHAELDHARCRTLRVGLVHGRMKPDEKAAMMAAFVARRDQRAGGDDGDRGRRRRAQRVADGDRARRALRALAAPPVARPRRPRRRGEHVRAAVRGAARPTWRSSG